VTKQSVFVEKERWGRVEGTWRDYDVEAYRLNRAKLMEKGEVWSHEARERFYTKPREERRQEYPAYRPQYLEDLDLPSGATKAQIESQFRRLARKHHPDCGGDAETSKRIRAAYEHAIDRIC
jgi:hypothetical protein